MKIAVIGAGAMGSIYGGHLSLKNDVYLIDKNEKIINAINSTGLKVSENNEDVEYRPKAVKDTKNLPKMDLIILFVKALYSKAALDENRHLIDEHTYLMTLQNGSGHEALLSQYVSQEKLIIGTTEDNGAVLDHGYIKRGGEGRTNVGIPANVDDPFLNQLKSTFDACGFNTIIHKDIQQLIWDKLLNNVSLSAVTGVLQCRIGYVYENSDAWQMVQLLLGEAVDVARALGLEVDEEKVIKKLINTATNSPDGVTSICADIRNSRKTEVDTISGSVIKAAEMVGINVPLHQFVVDTIHALEARE